MTDKPNVVALDEDRLSPRMALIEALNGVDDITDVVVLSIGKDEKLDCVWSSMTRAKLFTFEVYLRSIAGNVMARYIIESNSGGAQEMDDGSGPGAA